MSGCIESAEYLRGKSEGYREGYLVAMEQLPKIVANASKPMVWVVPKGSVLLNNEESPTTIHHQGESNSGCGSVPKQQASAQ